MGIFIYLEVSKSTTEEEWNRVYQESLELVDAFPLAERGKIAYCGKQVICAVRTKERKMPYGGGEEYGWRAEMDYDRLNWAEEYYLPKNLIDSHETDKGIHDAMMSALPAYLGYSWDEKRFNHYYPMVRMKLDDMGLNRLTRALVLNEELYESAEEWSREYE